MFDHFELPQSHFLFLIVGIFCLAFGRRSLGLIIAVTGLYLGGRLAKAYWGEGSFFLIVLFAAFSGLSGFILSKISKTAALNIAAFAIGGFVFSSLLVQWGMVSPQYEAVLFIVFGLLAAVFATLQPDLGLAAVSSVLGAALLVQISGGQNIMQAGLFAGLALAGIFIQTGLLSRDFGRARNSTERRPRS